MIKEQKIQIINEGLGSIFSRIGEFFSGGRPKIANLDTKTNIFYKAKAMCRRVHPPIKDVDIDVDLPNFAGEKNPDGSEKQHKIKYEDFEENPRYVICILEARVRYAEDLINFLKKTPTEELCKYNTNKQRCAGWVSSNIGWLTENLKDVKLELAEIKKIKDPVGQKRNGLIVYKKLTEMVDKYLDQI